MSDIPCLAPTGAERTRYGEVPRYQEGVYALAAQTYGWLVPNGSWGEANAGLVVGEGEALLIDTLWDVAQTRRMLDALAPYHRERPITHVVNTHADGDHYWGNQLLADAEIVTSKASLEEMPEHRPKTMLALERLGRLMRRLPSHKARQAGHWFAGLCAPYDFRGVVCTPATRSFSGDMTLQIGGREVRLIGVGQAHTQGDLLVHVPDVDVLFAADILFVRSTPVMWAGPVENWLRAIDRILEIDAKIIVPGHGPLARREDVQAVRDYWTFLTEEAHRRFAAGMPAGAAAAGIASARGFRERGYGAWDSPERIMLNIHMLYRHFRGRSRRPNAWSIVRILYAQALLAHAMPSATPQAMRLSEANNE